MTRIENVCPACGGAMVWAGFDLHSATPHCPNCRKASRAQLLPLFAANREKRAAFVPREDGE